MLNHSSSSTFGLTAGAHRLFAMVAVSICCCLAPLPVQAAFVDHIAAAVNLEVITTSDLDHAVALNLRLGGTDRDLKTLEEDTLNGLINRRLIVQEARRLRFVEVTDADISAEVDKLRSQFGSSEAFEVFLEKKDLTDRELSRMLGEQLLVRRFIEKKVGLFVRVNRDEAEHYFHEHASEFKGRSFPDVIKDIVAIITDRKVGQQLDQYVAELRAKADIRINPPAERMP